MQRSGRTVAGVLGLALVAGVAGSAAEPPTSSGGALPADGPGWSGATQEPGAVGNSGDPRYTAKAVPGKRLIREKAEIMVIISQK